MQIVENPADGTLKIIGSGSCTVSWTDAEGVSGSMSVAMSGGQGTCDPPLGCDLKVTCGSESAAYHALAADKVTLTDTASGSSFAMRFNAEESAIIEPDTELVQYAGRKLPVARFGLARSVTFDVSGVLLTRRGRPLRGSSWLPELRGLSEPRTWVYRSPGGTRRKVAVVSVGATRTGPGSVEVKLKLAEVE